MKSNIDIFDNFFQGKRVIVTGHTGFKGSWLTIWLKELGADVLGIGLDPSSCRDNFVISKLGEKLGPTRDIRANILDLELMKKIFSEFNPDIVFHLAAQPLVRVSYEKPVDTYMVNVIGTINILEAIKTLNSKTVGVMITTDKCYENKEQIWGYRETDPLGGYDPYSSSKGAAEIAIASWRNSFFNPKDYDRHRKSIASVRAGNVIGGGDWCKDRIIPDCIRALEAKKPIEIRSPHSIRPWQHVLEPLSGYMLLAKKMWENPTKYCEAWNFGPNPDNIKTVLDVASLLVCKYTHTDTPDKFMKDVSDNNQPHEANLLMLNINKARFFLNWQPSLSLEQSIKLTAEWYKQYLNSVVYDLTLKQIKEFSSLHNL